MRLRLTAERQLDLLETTGVLICCFLLGYAIGQLA